MIAVTDPFHTLDGFNGAWTQLRAAVPPGRLINVHLEQPIGTQGQWLGICHGRHADLHEHVQRTTSRPRRRPPTYRLTCGSR